MEEQEDELLALHSILGSEEFVRNESKSAGEIRVSVELPADFTVLLEEGEIVRQYEISFLPPLLLTFELPEDYPSSSPPSFTLTCSWLSHTQLSALSAQLTALYQATGGAVVLFNWVQFLKQDALRFLDIHNRLELPSDEHNTQCDNQDSLDALLSEPNDERHTESGHTDKQSCDVSDPCEPDFSAPWRERAEQNPSASNGSRTDSHRVVVLNSLKTDRRNSLSHVRQAEQTSELKAEHQDDPSSEGESNPLPFGQSDQSSQEGSVSAPSSSGLRDQQGASSAQIQRRESPRDEDQTLCDLRPTLSQSLLSQLLIYDAAHIEKAFSTTVFDCGVCFMGWLGSDCVKLPECGHIFCRTCLAEFCKLQITEGNVRGVICPQADCTAAPTPAQVKSLVGEELFRRYDRLLLQNTLDCMPDVVYCPRRSCGSAVIQEKSSTAALCSVCGFAFCVTCRKTYHGTDDCQTKHETKKQIDRHSQEATADLPQSQVGIMALWDDYASGSKQRQQLLERRYSRKILQETVADYLSEDWIVLNSKNCPHCFCRIQRVSGCNVMTCSQCRRQFCWACLARLTSTTIGKHFDNSGCSLYSYNPT